jgi:hypothetical protein
LRGQEKSAKSDKRKDARISLLDREGIFVFWRIFWFPFLLSVLSGWHLMGDDLIVCL